MDTSTDNKGRLKLAARELADNRQKQFDGHRRRLKTPPLYRAG